MNIKVTKDSIQQKQQLDVAQASLQSFKYFYLNKNRINQNIYNTIKNTNNNSSYNVNYKNQATSLCTINNINNINNNSISSQKYSSYYYYNPASFYDLTVTSRKQWCPIKIESLARYFNFVKSMGEAGG